MRRLALGLSLMGCLLAPATSLALGLGSMKVRTTLNQPLQADIGLVGTTADELQGVSVRLAAPKLFEQVGIPRPDYLDRLQFKVIRGSDGASYIQVTTRDAVKQPFLDFLLEVNWPGGRLVREYTVLLNPPNYMKGKPEVATRAPTVAAAPVVQRSPTPATKPVPSTSAAQSTSKPTAGAAMSAGSAPAQYRVRRGDTLLQVAKRMQPNQTASVNQVMIALLRANPDAFIHKNINGLKQGYVLRMPPSGAVTGIGKGQADAEVHKQNSLWREYASRMAGHTVAQSQLKAADHSGQGTETTAPKSGSSSNARLKIMGTEPSGSGNAKGSTKVAMAGGEDAAKLKHDLAIAQESAASNKQKLSDLESRVQALQGIVDKQQKLIDLKNQQLANLQKQLGSNASANAATSVAPAETTKQPAAEAAMPAGSTRSATAAVVAPSSTTEKASAVAPANASTTAPASVAAAPASATTAAPTTVASPAMVKPAKQEAPKPPASKPVATPKPMAQPSLVDDLMGNPNMLMAAGGVGLLLLALLWLIVRRSAKSRAAAQAASASAVATDPELGMTAEAFDADAGDESEESEAGIEDEAGTAEPTEEEASQDTDTLADEEAPKAVDAADDVLAEADVYIAYGLYQQAEDVLRKALDAEPGRDDYRAKLIECHFGAKNVSAFETEAKQLHENLSHPEVDALWIRVATLGKELVPDNPLFTGTDTGGLTSADVISAEPPSGELDLGADEFDLGDLSDIGDVGEVSEAEHADETNLEFDDLLDSEVSEETASPNESDEEVLELGDLDIGESELETFEGGAESGATDAEGFDLEEPEALDLGDEETADDTSEAPDVGTELLEEEVLESADDSLGGLDFSLDDLDISSDLQTEDVAGDKDDTGLDLTIDDLPVQEAATEDAEDFESLDLDTGAFDLEAETATLDDVSSDSTVSPEAEEGLTLDDLPEPDVGLKTEEATQGDVDTLSGSVGDEVATKLDLAKAYIDMGDTEGAQSALEEVVAEGDEAQKQEAQELLKQLG